MAAFDRVTRGLWNILRVPNLRRGELLRFGPVDPYGDVSTGGAQLLVEPGVRSDPEVLLGDLYLEHTGSTDISTTGLLTSQRRKKQKPGGYFFTS